MNQSPKQAVEELRERARDILFKAAGGVSDMANVEIDAVLDAVADMLEKTNIIGSENYIRTRSGTVITTRQTIIRDNHRVEQRKVLDSLITELRGQK